VHIERPKETWLRGSTPPAEDQLQIASQLEALNRAKQKHSPENIDAPIRDCPNQVYLI
jgi:hypothetical protein